MDLALFRFPMATLCDDLVVRSSERGRGDSIISYADFTERSENLIRSSVCQDLSFSPFKCSGHLGNPALVIIPVFNRCIHCCRERTGDMHFLCLKESCPYSDIFPADARRGQRPSGSRIQVHKTGAGGLSGLLHPGDARIEWD